MKLPTVPFLVFLACVFEANVADVVIPDQRFLEAYTDDDCQGPHTEFFDYVPDLSAYLIDNAIRSINYTGFWLVYSGVDYEGTWLGDFHDVQTCSDLSISDVASSLRYAGSPYGLNDVYYNLYEGTDATGAEFRGNTNAATVGVLDLNVSSLIITGQSPWTFFTGLEFTGPAVCVYPEYLSTGGGIRLYVSHAYSLADIGLPDNSIRSVAKGCFSEKVVRLSHSRTSLHLDKDQKVNENVH